MKVYNYTSSEQEIIDTYDKENHNFWTDKVKELTSLRLNLRAHYLVEQKNRCCYCKMLKQEKHGSTWDVEHIVPKSPFPRFLFEQNNLSLCCKECNDAKSDKSVFIDSNYDYKNYPLDNKKYSIIHPHLDKYSDHMIIRMSPDGKIMHIPQSDKGKVVFYHCDLVRFTMQFFNVEDLDLNLLITYSSFIDTVPNLTHETAKAFFTASLPRVLPAEYIDC
ncbi:HNH endonuclease [Acinetobacter kookii]